ncbi:hypothetical protein UlMin_003305 [Ulmus minor]
MAEMVVAPVINVLAQLLVEEANWFKGVHREVKSLKDELESIRCFLKDAEERSEKRERWSEDLGEASKGRSLSHRRCYGCTFRHEVHRCCPEELEELSQEIVKKCQGLYRYWIAEGFVTEKRGKTLEQVAEEYLNELIQRNLVQVWGLLCGSDKLCRVHDLLHDIIISRANEMGFCQILDEKSSKISGKSRRLSIQGTENAVETILDFMFTAISELPVEITKLQNLRVLLGFYHNLEAGFSITTFSGTRTPKGFGCLENLHILGLVNGYHRGAAFFKELENLKQLRWLIMSDLATENERALCVAIEKMNHLERLNLVSINKDVILALEALSSPPPFLSRLQLTGRLQKLPNWVSKLQNLSTLGLNDSRLADDPLKYLKNLPSLVYLWLLVAYEGEQLHFEQGGFQKLKLLQLNKLDGLKEM